MRIYPAIDIKGGQCVRLHKGRFQEVTVYSDNPWEVAAGWQAQGGEFIHTVDLDGALQGKSVNAEIFKKITQAVTVPVQLGGGIRSMEGIENALSYGISRVILGTAAVNDRAFLLEAVKRYGEKIVVGIDAKDGFVAIDGWETVSGHGAVEFGREVQDLGVKTIIYTDIATDGTLKGPNLGAMEEMARALQIDVIASGGVGTLADIKALTTTGVSGVIVGKALYEGTVQLADAIKIGRDDA